MLRFDVKESKKLRVIIDTDTACEADDPFASDRGPRRGLAPRSVGLPHVHGEPLRVFREAVLIIQR